MPPGKSPAFIRYDESDGWRVQLEGVEDRDGIPLAIRRKLLEIGLEEGETAKNRK